MGFHKLHRKEAVAAKVNKSRSLWRFFYRLDRIFKRVQRESEIRVRIDIYHHEVKRCGEYSSQKEGKQ